MPIERKALSILVVCMILASILGNSGLLLAGTGFHHAFANEPPVANAGDDQAVDEGFQVTLNGSASDHPDDNPITYFWNQTSGPSVGLDDPASATPSFTAPQVSPANATLTFQLTVNDDIGGNDTDSVEVIVNNVPMAPVADAGPDQSVSESTPVSLDGTASSDADGDTLTYSWNQINGTAIALLNATTAEPSFNAPEVTSGGETLTFELTVDDGNGGNATDIVNIIVNNINQSPVADAGIDQSVIEEGVVMLNGSGSSDPDSDPLTYFWNQTAGIAVTLVNATTITPTFVSPSIPNGTEILTFELIVDDGFLASDTDSVNITVNDSSPPDGAPPIANAGSNLTVDEGTNVILDGTASSDSDGTISSFSWNQTSGTVVALDNDTSAMPSFDAPDIDDSEILSFNLIVTDNDGNTSSDSISITVIDSTATANSSPTANAGPDQTVNEGILVTLDGTASSDPDGDTLTYSWAQTSGLPVELVGANTSTPSFTAPEVNFTGAILTFQLTVDDGLGGNAFDTVNVTINNLQGYHYLPSFIADGTNYFDTNHHPSLSLETFSLATWFKTTKNYATSTTKSVIANKGGFGIDAPGQNMNYGIWVDNGSTNGNKIEAGFEISAGPDVFVRSPGTYNDGQWHYAVLTYDKSVLRLYIDGAQAASKSTTAIPDNIGTQPLRIGADALEGKRFFSGEIDEERVWNRAISSKEIIDQYNQGILDTSGLLVHMDGVSNNVAPIANAGPDQTVNEGVLVTLDGTASSDPDGDALSYSWTQTAGPSVTLTGANTATPSFTAPNVPTSGNTLTFKLTVNDGHSKIRGGTTTDNVNISVQNVNQPPVANAGTNQTVGEGTLVTLDGTASSDPDGDALSYSWTQTAGPSVTLTGANTATPTFTAPEVRLGGDVLTFRLTVNDGKGGTSTDDVDVTVQNVNQPPVANAGPDQIVNEGVLVTLQGTASSDPDSYPQPLTFLWEQVDSSGLTITLSDATSATPTFTAPDISVSSTVVTFRLTVNDGAASNTDTVNITINNVGAAGYHYSPSYIAGGASYTDVPDNLSLRLEQFTLATWFKTSKDYSTATAKSVIVNKGGFGIDAPGKNMNYGIWVDFGSTNGNKIEAGFETSAGPDIFVRSPLRYNDGQWHYAVLTYDKSVLRLYIDGAQVASKSTTAVPDTTGNQPLRIGADALEGKRFFTGEIDEVRVWNSMISDAEVADQYNQGIFNTVGLRLHFNGVSANQYPFVNAGSDQVAIEGTLVTLDGTASSDPDGDALSYSWTQTAGPSVTLTGANTATPTFTAPEVGIGGDVLTFRLTVNDGKGGTSTDDADVVIQHTNQPPVANAGLDQNANEGTDPVILLGADSSDPDGDPLTYSWMQTAGPTVFLDDPNAENPSFTAPIVAFDVTLSFSLTVSDGSSNSTASVNVMVINTAGGYNYSPAFPATGSSSFSITHHPSLSLQKFSLAAWFKTTKDYAPLTVKSVIANKGGFGFEDPGKNMNYGIWVENGSTDGNKIGGGFETSAGPDIFLKSSAKYNDGQWHYAVLTHDGSILRLYVDGTEVAFRSGGAPDTTGTQPLRIGANSLQNDRYFTGEIDEVRVWSRALVTPEISEQYFSGIFSLDGQLVHMNGVSYDSTPITSAGPDQTVNEGDPVSLTSTGTSDPDGQPITYSWIQTAGPSVTLTGASTPNPSFTAPTVAFNVTLSFSLTVSDGQLQSTDFVNINVINTAGGYRYAPAYTFSGNQYIDVPDSATLHLQRFSVAAWFKTPSTSTSQAMIVNKGGFGTDLGGQNMNYGIWLENTQKVSAGFEKLDGTDIFLTSSATYNDGLLHYAVLTYDGSTLRLYIDGLQIASRPTTSSPDTTGTQPLRIGANSLQNDRYFTGEIDEVRVWSSALTQADISNQYFSGIISESDQVQHVDMAHVPLANPGSIQVVTENNQGSLDGTGSFDPDAAALTYSWIRLSGQNVTITNANRATAFFTAPDVVGEKSLVFQLSVNDGSYTATNTVRKVVIDSNIQNTLLKTPDYMNDIASEIDNATSSVHAAMFYVEPYSTNKVIDALERAVDRGVEVRLVFSDHTLQQYPDTPTLLTDKGIPYVIISNHFKVVVIDNKIAYVGSANWNKNGLERNRELTLKTNSPDTVAEAYDLLNILWLQGSKKVVVNDFYYERFANGFEYNNLLLESIKNAQSIKVLMFMVDYNSTNMNAPETKLLNEVRSAYQRGANVQMVLDDPKYFEVPGGGHFFTRNNVPHKLDQKNIGTDERLHAKAILVDDQMLFVGSQNWHDDHLDSAQDASIITRNPQAIADYLTIFNNEWSLAHDP